MTTKLSALFCIGLTAILPLCCTPSDAQTTTTAKPFPIALTVNSSTIGSMNCSFDSPYVTTGSCLVSVTAANWCVANLSTSPVLAMAAISGTNGSTAPPNCVTSASLPIALSACSPTRQPYNITLTGLAYNSAASQPKPLCKGPHVRHKEDDENSRDSSGRIAYSKTEDHSDHHHYDDDCDHEDSETYHSGHKHLDRDSYRRKYGRDYQGSITHKDGICDVPETEEREHHHTGGGSSGGGTSGSTTGSAIGATYPLNQTGQLPCQTPQPL